eukprot:969466_1
MKNASLHIPTNHRQLLIIILIPILWFVELILLIWMVNDKKNRYSKKEGRCIIKRKKIPKREVEPPQRQNKGKERAPKAKPKRNKGEERNPRTDIGTGKEPPKAKEHWNRWND